MGREWWRKALQIEVPHSADIDSAFQGMLAESVGHVIAELCRLRLCDTGLVPPNRSQPGTGAEVKCRKCVRRWVLADVHSGQIELTQRVRSLNRKIYARCDICEAVAKLVQQPWSNRIGVREQEAAI